MQEASAMTGLLSASARLYRAILILYPAEFRRAYGPPMEQVFRDCSRRSLRESGAAGLLGLWIRTFFDTLQTALEEHAQRGVEMTREKFIRLGGWALMLGPILYLVGAWANNRPEYSPWSSQSLPIDRVANQAAAPLLVVGQLLISLGLFALLQRYWSRLDGTGGLILVSILAGVASAVGVAVMSVNDVSPWWQIILLGLAVQFTALTVFGVINLRRRLLPRWNGLPLLAAWFPIALFLSSGLVNVEISSQALAWLWLLSIVMFGGLGYVMQVDPAVARPAAVG